MELAKGQTIKDVYSVKFTDGMELTFKDLDKAQKAALDLVNFGKVRIERCYIMNKAIDVVYKLYVEVLWANEDLLKVIESYSNDFEEDLAYVRNVLTAKEAVAKEILRLLEGGGRYEEEVVKAVRPRFDVSREAVKALIDDLEEEGFVMRDELGRVSLVSRC